MCYLHVRGQLRLAPLRPRQNAPLDSVNTMHELTLRAINDATLDERSRVTPKSASQSLYRAVEHIAHVSERLRDVGRHALGQETLERRVRCAQLVGREAVSLENAIHIGFDNHTRPSRDTK